MQEVVYNERSWAIDVISYINQFVDKRKIEIKRAGGENSLKVDEDTLFPDVLLFGDENEGKILQGWELKFPDTPINDPEFIDNAKRKALSLQLNSFILWNVTNIVLYLIKDDESLEILKSWNNLADITLREDVFPERRRILSTIEEIIPIINGFFSDGVIKTTSVSSVITSESMFSIIQRNVNRYAEDLEDYALQNKSFSDEITIWWRYAKIDFPEENNKFHVLARDNLFFLLNKIVFAHLLKSFDKGAKLIDEIKENSSINEAMTIFTQISESCDFWDIFNNNIGEKIINSSIWSDFVKVNQLLKEFQIQNIDRSFLQDVLNNLIAKNKRKIAGQYATPRNLAKLLVHLTLLDRNGQCLDPCCGSGTIIREIYNYKRQVLNPSDAYESIWGSDKYSFPLSIASINFADPSVIGILRKLFKADASNLVINQPIQFKNPYTGDRFEEKLPSFQYIVSNLPFVRFESIGDLNPNVYSINEKIESVTGISTALGGRSDLYAYLPFYLFDLLNDNGILTIIISNSWLGTAWGENFYRILKYYFHVKVVVTSGKGRWFDKSKIITNVVVLQKKNSTRINEREKTKFVTLKQNIEDLSEDENIEEISALINNKEVIHEDDISIISYSNEKIEKIRSLGLNLNSFFTDNNWLMDFQSSIIKTKEIFSIQRGIRRGWDQLFYPKNPSSIESDYLMPVLKTPRSIRNLIAIPDSMAFCCSLSIEELRRKNHQGAINWIKSFENLCNERGEPLTEVLAQSNSYWYSLEPNVIGEYAASINFGDRIFISKFIGPTLVNQRMITITRINSEIDLNLCHALLNSILSQFYIEAMGFGRGEGALDLNKDYFEENFHIFNPCLINENEKREILKAFNPIVEREVLPILEEIEAEDRISFDNIVFEVFGLQSYYPLVKKSLIDLYSIRTAIK